MMGTAAYLITVARELEQEYRKDKICEELAPLLPVFDKMDKKAFLLNIQSRNGIMRLLPGQAFLQVIGGNRRIDQELILACLYKVLPNHVDEIPAEEITITLIRDRKPVKLMQELEKSGYECKKETAGIYYVYGVMFPVQIIASSELDTDMHVQLKALTNQLNETVMRQYLLEVSAFAEREKNLADIVLQVIVNGNMEKVREWKGSERIMCEALRVLMADELNEERMEGQREGRIEGQREGRIEGQREGRIEGQREGQIRAYASLVQDGIITVETGAEKTGMSVGDFTKEMKQAGYVIPAV